MPEGPPGDVPLPPEPRVSVPGSGMAPDGVRSVFRAGDSEPEPQPANPANTPISPANLKLTWRIHVSSAVHSNKPVTEK